MLLIALIILLLKLAGIINLSWILVVVILFLLLVVSIFELKCIYKIIDKRFK